MECILQTLDDLEDLAYAFALNWERIRRACRFAIFIAIAILLQILAVVLTFYYLPLAFAIIALTLVGLLYHRVTTRKSDYLPFA